MGVSYTVETAPGPNGINRISLRRVLRPAPAPLRDPALPLAVPFSPPSPPTPPVTPETKVAPTPPQRRGPVPATCSQCGKRFQIVSRHRTITPRLYCSARCREKAWIQLRGEARKIGRPLERFCEECPNPIPPPAPGKAYQTRQRYCGESCYRQVMHRKKQEERAARAAAPDHVEAPLPPCAICGGALPLTIVRGTGRLYRLRRYCSEGCAQAARNILARERSRLQREASA